MKQDFFLEVITPPLIAIPLVDVKEHLKISHSLDDAVITSMIESATQMAENFTNTSFMKRVYEITIDLNNLNFMNNGNEITLPRNPIDGINYVKLVISSGEEEFIPASSYRISANREKVEFKTNMVFANRSVNNFGNRVKIEYIAGKLQDAKNMPTDVRQAILLLVTDLYEGRLPNSNDAQNLTKRAEIILQRHKKINII